ncbi:MAG TPA: DsbC family protein [Burkholderiales bacterium]|nr:DsbC family protein [Burkholderiales bacterium]
MHERMLRVLCLLFALQAFPVLANEALIRQVVESKLGGAKVEGVQASPMPGLFEVRFRTPDGVQIVYTNADATHILIGTLIDVKSERNLTEERMRRFSAINMESLPYDLAVKVRRGNGKRTLVVFSDPYCPACKQFEKVLASIDDITIHYFMYPVIRPELADHSRAVWCAPDRSKAWLDLALHGKPLSGGAKCDAPLDKVLDLGSKLGVRSTPTMFFASGERVRGGMSATQLKAMLDESSNPKK